MGEQRQDRRWWPMRALDASFLFAESDRTPMHVGTVAVFDGAPFFDATGGFRLADVRARVGERLHLLPQLRRRVVTVPLGLGRPLWIDDPDFDIARHVVVEALSSPGDRPMLEALVDRLEMEPLDRDRPLWELRFVTGLDDGRVALVERIHHAAVDGVGGVDLAAVLLDLDPDPEPVEAPPWSPAPAPAGLELLAVGAVEGLRRPIQAGRWLASQLASPTRLWESAAGARALAGAVLSPGERHRRSSLRVPVGDRRRLVPVPRPLDELRAVAGQFKVTVNDVVLAAVVAGVLGLLRRRGEAVPSHLHLLVPVSTRAEDEHGDLGNRVAAMLVSVPTHEADPMLRLMTVHQQATAMKRQHGPLGTAALLEGIELLPAPLLALLSSAIHRQPFVDLVVTNVPGPDVPLFFLGAELLETIPIVPLGGNLSVGVAALSYEGTLTLGLHADADRCADVDQLADEVDAAFDELASFLVPEEVGYVTVDPAVEGGAEPRTVRAGGAA